jgi:GTP cyclohydrolase I
MTVENIPGHHRADSAIKVGRIEQATGEVIEAPGEDLFRTRRGARKASSSMVTSPTRCQFRQNQVTRAEFPSLVRDS